MFNVFERIYALSLPTLIQAEGNQQATAELLGKHYCTVTSGQLFLQPIYPSRKKPHLLINREVG
jgi:hypothetical protein